MGDVRALRVAVEAELADDPTRLAEALPLVESSAGDDLAAVDALGELGALVERSRRERFARLSPAERLVAALPAEAKRRLLGELRELRDRLRYSQAGEGGDGEG